MREGPGCRTLAQDAKLLLICRISQVSSIAFGEVKPSDWMVFRRLPRSLWEAARPGLLTVLIRPVALSQNGVDERCEEVVVSAETSKICLTAAPCDCLEDCCSLRSNDQPRADIWRKYAVQHDLTIQLGAAAKIASISGVYSLNSIIVDATAAFLLLSPIKEPQKVTVLVI